MSSLAKLRPVLYEGRCRLELPALDARARVSLLGYYKSAELDVTIRPTGIGGVPISARVAMLGLERYVAGGAEGALLEIPDVDGLHVLTLRAFYSRKVLEVSIRRRRMSACHDSARVSLEGLPEFFKWCVRASKIYFEGGRLCGFDVEELALLCGVRRKSTGVQVGAFDEFELTGVDILGGDLAADADADAQQRAIV